MAVTLQQIADACDVSRGTVDRALRDREGVRPEVAERIRQQAREMGYIPRKINLVSSIRPPRIGIVLHTGTSDFVQQLAAEMRNFPKTMPISVEPIIRIMNDTNVQHQLTLIDELVINEQIDGLALMPLASTLIRDKINSIAENDHIPVITLNTDLSDCNRLAYVGPDNIACGRTAAALMGMVIGGHGQVLPMLGQSSGHFADSQRLQGFLEEMHTSFPNVTVLPPEYCFLDQDLAERICRRALHNCDNLSGIYISSVGRSGVYRAVSQENSAGRVHIVVHDDTPDNLQMIREGVVDFAIGQDMKTQSSLPFLLLYQYITKHESPKKRLNITQIDIKFRCNLPE